MLTMVDGGWQSYLPSTPFGDPTWTDNIRPPQRLSEEEH